MAGVGVGALELLPFMSISVESIGAYRVERELGEGSFLACESNGRRVVLKMLEADCLLKGQLHPMIKDRLGRAGFEVIRTKDRIISCSIAMIPAG